MKTFAPLLLLALLPHGEPLAPGRLTELERAAGWRMLFDGESIDGESADGWVRYGGDAFPAEGWDVEDGCLHKVPGVGGGDIVLAEPVGDFELELEFRVAPGANSGIKYRVPPADAPRAMLGPEYQVLDDAGHPKEAAQHKSGALYAMYAPEGGAPVTSGGWHRARIVARGDRIEHWLDGVRVVEATVGSEDWSARKAASKFARVDGFAEPRIGHIGLQDHGGEVWYRDLRLRAWPPPGEAVDLVQDGTLDGWRAVGDAVWEPGADEILGYVGGGGQSFLVSERSFGDFVFECELRTEEPGNSGIQIRSHQRENGRVYGYQVEIDPSDRSWSGGIYDEARRGWIDDLADNEPARDAFDRDGWNRYRVECVGPWIRTWVNGVPAADCFDPLDLEGFLALQVHSGNNTRVRWRNLRLWDLGERSWEDSGVGERSYHSELRYNEIPGYPPMQVELEPPAGGDFAVRARFTCEGAEPSVEFRVPDLAELPHSLHAAAAGLGVNPAGCWFSFSRALPEGEALPEQGTLTLLVYGRRLSAFLDGRRLLDFRELPDSTAGGLLLKATGETGANFTLESVELLGPPR
jgi:hypothetical protein